LLLRQDEIDRSIERLSVTADSRDMSAGEKRHYRKTSHGRLTAFQRGEGSVGLLLRSQPSEAAVDAVVNFFPSVNRKNVESGRLLVNVLSTGNKKHPRRKKEGGNCEREQVHLSSRDSSKVHSRIRLGDEQP
jgi:hypothetical protein